MASDRERLKEEREEANGQVIFTSSSEDEEEQAYLQMIRDKGKNKPDDAEEQKK